MFGRRKGGVGKNTINSQAGLAGRPMLPSELPPAQFGPPNPKSGEANPIAAILLMIIFGVMVIGVLVWAISDYTGITPALVIPVLLFVSKDILKKWMLLVMGEYGTYRTANWWDQFSKNEHELSMQDSEQDHQIEMAKLRLEMQRNHKEVLELLEWKLANISRNQIVAGPLPQSGIGNTTQSQLPSPVGEGPLPPGLEVVSTSGVRNTYIDAKLPEMEAKTLAIRILRELFDSSGSPNLKAVHPVTAPDPYRIRISVPWAKRGQWPEGTAQATAIRAKQILTEGLGQNPPFIQKVEGTSIYWRLNAEAYPSIHKIYRVLGMQPN